MRLYDVTNVQSPSVSFAKHLSKSSTVAYRLLGSTYSGKGKCQLLRIFVINLLTLFGRD